MQINIDLITIVNYDFKTNFVVYYKQTDSTYIISLQTTTNTCNFKNIYETNSPTYASQAVFKNNR